MRVPELNLTDDFKVKELIERSSHPKRIKDIRCGSYFITVRDYQTLSQEASARRKHIARRVWLVTDENTIVNLEGSEYNFPVYEVLDTTGLPISMEAHGADTEIYPVKVRHYVEVLS